MTFKLRAKFVAILAIFHKDGYSMLNVSASTLNQNRSFLKSKSDIEIYFEGE